MNYATAITGICVALTGSVPLFARGPVVLVCRFVQYTVDAGRKLTKKAEL
jgi:hypothetical protein